MNWVVSWSYWIKFNAIVFVKKRSYILLIIVIFSVYNARAAESADVAEMQMSSIADTVESVFLTQSVADPEIAVDEFKPDPVKALWMGAIVPGYGQIVNRKYWKLPIVYAGFIGCAYAITWNSSRYISYKRAYLDITDSDPNTNSFIDILPAGYTVDMYGGISGYTSVLNTAMDKSRYNRDLSVILSVGYYLLTLVDAYVDAHLYDFDISPDLSMRFKPAIIDRQYGMSKSYGLQCSFTLK